MQIEYEISEQDFLEAQKLAIKKHPSRTTRLIFRILPFWGLFLFLGVAWPVFQRGFTWNTGMILPSSFAVLALASPLLMQRARRNMYRKTLSLHGQRSVTVDQTGLKFSGSGYSSELEWEFFPKWAEDDKTFVLYQSNRTFNVIPKRALSQQEISGLREAFTRNIVSGS
jgi:hypothetical protein